MRPIAYMINIIVLLSTVYQCHSSCNDLEVTLSNGVVQGISEAGIRVWLGIRYADPPARWENPKFSKKVDFIQYANQTAPSCIQACNLPKGCYLLYASLLNDSL